MSARKNINITLLVAVIVVCTFMGKVFACAAITKNGTQCKRAPSPGSAFCWQHGGKSSSTSSYGTASYGTIRDALPQGDSHPVQTYRQEKYSYCQAVYSNGVRCNCFVDDGCKYCILHANYDPDNPPTLKVIKIPKTTEEKRADTLLRLQKIEEAILKYKQRGAHKLPAQLATLNALFPTANKFSVRDAWGTAFRYESEGLDYLIVSAGPDCKFDTEDDLSVTSLKE